MTTTSSTSSTSSTTASSTLTGTTTATDSASIGASILQSLGGGGGLSINTTTLATQLATAEYAGQTAADNTALSKVALQLSQASQLSSDLQSFSSAMYSLVTGNTLLPSPTVANSAVASASLPDGSAGSTSSYSLEVDQLAQAQVVATGSSASSATFQGGTLTFNFGTISNGTFTQGSASPATVSIAAGASLSDIALAINGANMGVTAYVASNSSGNQLVIKGAQGAANAFTITSATTDTSSGTSDLSGLAYDPSSTSSTNAQLIASSQDAQYKLDGISRTSASNTITRAAPGLSLSLTGTNVGNPTTITYSDPTSSITATMNNLVSSLNSLVNEVNTDTKASTGNLYADAGAAAVKKALSSLAGTTIMPNANTANGEPATLADLGLKLNLDGTFSLDTTQLNKALSKNVSAVAGMFTDGVNGVYSTVFKMVNNLTSSTVAGSLATSVSTYTTQQTNLNTDLTNISSLQSELRTRLITQLAAANSSISTYNSTGTYLTNLIAQWNKTSN